MSSDRQESESSHWPILLTIGVPGLLLLYALSHAPVGRLCGGRPPAWTAPAYRPLCELADGTPYFYCLNSFPLLHAQRR